VSDIRDGSGEREDFVKAGAEPSKQVTTSRIPHIRIAVSARNAWKHLHMDKGTILVVEDEPNIADLVDLYLSRDGFRVVKKATGEDGLAAIRDQHPRLVVLDVGLPDLDGLEVCRRIRATSALPVIFLTARADEVDRVLGLELGADDYLTKPFAPAELVARVKAVLRRTDGVPGAALVQVSGVIVDLGRREIRVHDEPVDFTTKEFELLRFLAERPGLAMSRHQILDAVWGHGWYGDERTVDVHIAQVRKKVGDACVIATVRGVGYRLEPAGA
jgi:DNA-binding response OmpR family regulator